MDHQNHNIESRKNKHLNFKERMTIEIRLADGCSAYKIAKELQRPINTIINEIRRGTTTQIKQGKHVEMYLADTGEAVTEAFNYLKDVYGTQFSKVFKSITGDNGSEFADLSTLENHTETKFYYTHPYSSFEKGTNERHNGLIRRFIPKGKRISDYSVDNIGFIEEWMNTLPRKILDYRTPEELFEKYLDEIYAA